jgi:hypothetical protein
MKNTRDIKDPFFKLTYKPKEVNPIIDPFYKFSYKPKEIKIINDSSSKPICKLKTKPIEVIGSVPMLNFIKDCCLGKPTIPEVKEELLQEVKERSRPLPEPNAPLSKTNARALPEAICAKPVIKKPEYYAVIHPRQTFEYVKLPEVNAPLSKANALPKVKEIKPHPIGSREWKKQQFLINNM